MQCATRFVEMLVFTSRELPQPYLRAEMAARVAEMLNYFLRHLVGPDRAQLRTADPAAVRFRCLPCPAPRCCAACVCILMQRVGKRCTPAWSTTHAGFAVDV